MKIKHLLEFSSGFDRTEIYEDKSNQVSTVWRCSSVSFTRFNGQVDYAACLAAASAARSYAAGLT